MLYAAIRCQEEITGSLNYLPKRAFAFLGEYMEEYVGKNDVRQAAQFISVTEYYPNPAHNVRWKIRKNT